MNVVRTAMLLAAMTVLFMLVGYAIGGRIGMTLALAFAAVTNIFSWWNSGKMVLRMHRAVEVKADNAPEFYAIVKALAERAGLPVPRTYLIDSPQPNAFATGRNPANAAVAASTGLLEKLTPEEVSGVIAHELAHIRNRDTLTMTVTATLAGAISMLGNFALFFSGSSNRGQNVGGFGALMAVIFAPFAALIVQTAISRTREYSADRLGAELTGHPMWLASALRKIGAASGHVINESAERHPATAHMFIVNPLSGLRLDSLFSTHPPLEERIAILEAMASDDRSAPPAAPQADPVAEPETPSSGGPWGRNAAQGRGPWS